MMDDRAQIMMMRRRMRRMMMMMMAFKTLGWLQSFNFGQIWCGGGSCITFFVFVLKLLLHGTLHTQLIKYDLRLSSVISVLHMCITHEANCNSFRRFAARTVSERAIKSHFSSERDNKKLFIMRQRAAAFSPLPPLWCECLCTVAHHPPGADFSYLVQTAQNKIKKGGGGHVWITNEFDALSTINPFYNGPASSIVCFSVDPPLSADTVWVSDPTSNWVQRVRMQYTFSPPGAGVLYVGGCLMVKLIRMCQCLVANEVHGNVSHGKNGRPERACLTWLFHGVATMSHVRHGEQQCNQEQQGPGRPGRRERTATWARRVTGSGFAFC